MFGGVPRQVSGTTRLMSENVTECKTGEGRMDLESAGILVIVAAAIAALVILTKRGGG
jgi:hypothetical protein